MDQKVVWSITAKKNLKRLIEWLTTNYGEEYAERSLRWIMTVTNEVANHPTKGMIINQERKLRRWRVDGHNYITYTITPNGITVKNILAYSLNKKGF